MFHLSAAAPVRDFSNRTHSHYALAQCSSEAFIAAVMGPGPYHNLRQGAIYRIEAIMQDFRERIVYSMRDETSTFENRESWSEAEEKIFRECFEPARDTLKSDDYLAVRMVGEEIRVTCEFILDLSDEQHNRFLRFRGHRGITWYLDIICDDFEHCSELWEMVQERYFLMSEVPRKSPQTNES